MGKRSFLRDSREHKPSRYGNSGKGANMRGSSLRRLARAVEKRTRQKAARHIRETDTR